MNQQFVRVTGRAISRIRLNAARSFNATKHTADHLCKVQSSSRRSMVTVTQTKVADLPVDEAPSNEINDISSFVQLSDALEVTSSCLNRVQSLIQQRIQKEGEESADHFLRVFVDAGGCSGFQYQFEVDNEFDEDEDIVVVATQDSTPRVVVDEVSLGFLKGSKLDYVQEMIKSAFVVAENPQSESACGCGSSFAVKNFEANPALD
ncbi:unnamed protein product [Cylindrotheca closterium]|uniref:Core domain-containing protein n=1 Tax=Cylindrotheca closterium TaxID=2856 RepID=A0AAD2GA17_9STRA|nr:unnamed protein product [Cylindrotheca closterium]